MAGKESGGVAEDEAPKAIDVMKQKAKEATSSNGDNSNGDHNNDDACNDDEEKNGVGLDNGNSSSADGGEDEEEEEMEEDDDEEEGGELQEEGQVNGEKSPEKTSRRKSPMKIRDIEELAESEEDENDVEEVKDHEESGTDSDIMEVEAEDPLAADQLAAPMTSTATSAATMSTITKSSSPNVVTIDDVKVLHKLANSAKKQEVDKPSMVLIDTNTILAGKATSGVTITPARPKTSGIMPALHGISSGVTISTSAKGPAIPLRGSSGMLGNTAFGYDQKGQLNDPNLTDDTFVVEAPSFIVPYVYEKPPKETFDAFRASVKKLVEEQKAVKSPATADAKDRSGDEDEEKKTSKSSDEEEIIELNKDTNEPKKRPPSDNFFDSSLGKFLFDLGMNMVQETVQADLLKQQIRKSQKDKSAAVMHAIMSLKKNLESSKEHNEPFHLKEKKCRFCSFRTESELCMLHHMETPHMKQFMYRCNYCPYETKMPQEVLTHMSTAHEVRGRLERAPGIHQCPQCPFEDNMKGKLTRHKNGCDKRFRPERNQEPSHDWEPPAKIPKPPMMARRPGGGGAMSGHPMGASQTLSQLASMRQISPGGGLQQQRNIYSAMPALQMGPRGRGRPIGTYKADLKIPNPMSRPGLTMNSLAFNKASNQMLNMAGSNYLNNQVVLQALNQQTNRFQAGSKILSNLGSNSSVTIQSVSQRSANNRSNTTPSISITPLPGRQSMSAGSKPPSSLSAMKPGQPSSAGAQGGKGSFVICEICDGYIKDLEQLRNHMLWIHKVKIHPKMIYNRPPLNCQKCQFRFFTDQGLERHLLGSHGLVTASMQELANKGQDSGRCPVCGKVYQWKLLNHVAKDHQKTLKPAHLSYKCTVCTATFGQYKLFESHVYQAHSGAAKKADKAKQLAKSSTIGKPPIKVPQDITVIPKPAEKKKPLDASSSKGVAVAAVPTVTAAKKQSDLEVIELDDEEEIDDVEEEEKGKSRGKRSMSGDRQARKKAKPSAEEDSGEEGVEEIEDEEPDDE